MGQARSEDNTMHVWAVTRGGGCKRGRSDNRSEGEEGEMAHNDAN